MPSSVRAGLALAILLAGVRARAQALPPQEPSSVSSGVPAAGPSALPAEMPQPLGEAVPQAPLVPRPESEKSVFETRVEAPAPTTAASADTIRERDLELRFYPTPEDILRVVPGLVIAQHQGGGKADQLFLRGFDADHGTDVALYIDGVPINLPSNGHGQGYADLHFLIPETVDRVQVTKGPYFVETGDFDTAGAVNLLTRRSFGENSVTGEY